MKSSAQLHFVRLVAARVLTHLRARYGAPTSPLCRAATACDGSSRGGPGGKRFGGRSIDAGTSEQEGQLRSLVSEEVHAASSPMLSI